MDISTALAADLAALTESLDEPGADISQTLRKIAADTKIAVRSYLGLSVILSVAGRRLTFTALEEDTEPEDIRSSLRMSLPPDVPAPEDPAATISLILFAAAPGAFLGLATDLSWLAGDGGGLGAIGFVLDEDLAVPHDPAAPSGLKILSTIDQAIGVLIGQGDTPEQARQRLEMLATDTGIDRPTAADVILAELDRPSWTDLGAGDGRPARAHGPGGELPTRSPRDP
ncbi:ANTAR domain-containing protein [Frankia sp. CNm7]|uniref:ANTAR domain-containing protein n=1 Tax=Frankia nepalensis TaxID=1836974 RepID=A0A937RJG8_9ACTN|nr:ANTAR domain-containing protein [Frankia nepalensis]MBL7495616.1 ANTAR domain-containing protein [Frankia nepalensis]MBL7520310.1 ANTAR domain-containing protein [Frankia nepalensis]MBL7630085.1 ANTAR domain-containing protein [Frankia nepalensis]